MGGRERSGNGGRQQKQMNSETPCDLKAPHTLEPILPAVCEKNILCFVRSSASRKPHLLSFTSQPPLINIRFSNHCMRLALWVFDPKKDQFLCFNFAAFFLLFPFRALAKDNWQGQRPSLEQKSKDSYIYIFLIIECPKVELLQNYAHLQNTHLPRIQFKRAYYYI